MGSNHDPQWIPGEARLERIYRLIGECDLGIHDISRTEVSPENYPRFNMPFELGLFLGCKRWGGSLHRRKHELVLEREQYRYRQFLSDLAGYDPEPHGDDVSGVIVSVRSWLQRVAGVPLRGPIHIEDDFRWFSEDLPNLCEESGLNDEDLSFTDLVHLQNEWLHELELDLPQ